MCLLIVLSLFASISFIKKGVFYVENGQFKQAIIKIGKELKDIKQQIDKE